MITSEHVDSTWELTRKLTEDCYPRLTGLPGCIKAGNMIKEDMETYCDTVETQQFTHRPRGFLKFLPYSATFHLIALILLFLGYMEVSLGIFSINALIFISQLLFYWGIFDFPFKKDEGTNVIGKIEPKEEVKQQIILSGHYDAPYVFQMIEKIPKYYALVFAIGLGTILISFIGTWIVYFAAGSTTTYAIVLAVLSLFTLPFYVFTTSQVSPGAGDNAIAVGLIAETGRIFSKDRLQHTRLIILALDAEEAGLNGARAYVNEFYDELHSIPTYNFNIDSIYDKKYLQVFTRDLNSIRKLSEEDAELVRVISRDLGNEISTGAMPLGGGSTDSAEFSRVGINSIAYVGLNLDGMNANTAYHSSRDDMSALHRDSIEFSLQIMEEYCLRKDQI